MTPPDAVHPVDPTEVVSPVMTGYDLAMFSREELEALPLVERNGKRYVRCAVTDKPRVAKPEEVVRQLFLRRLVTHYGYPRERIFLEKGVQFGSTVGEKRADIVVTAADDPETAYIIVELKKAKRRDGLEQLKSYCNAEGSPIGVWTNGGEAVYLHREEPNLFKSLPDLPRADQTLSALLEERWDLARLTTENRLVRERLTLKSIILDMEDLVLANAGVDAFEEVFKLIYAKLYDEWASARPGRRRFLEFRVGGKSPQEFFDTTTELFESAKRQWPGVFFQDEQIELSPPHLLTCGSFLEDIKLFNSNLQVIDEAFEYLSIQVGKGSKGQYFTPRHVIDMCVRMLHPKVDEYMIDTAAGSCGFTVHSIFHVWGNEFTAAGPSRWQSDYASEYVYAIDFDTRAVKIAKALNLIAGDGRTHVFRGNSLDPRNWSDELKVGMRDRLRRFRDRTADEANRRSYRYFDFDVLMTNPPFAGDIKDSRLLHHYDLGRKGKPGWQEKVSRDVLFVERNLEFVKPGGRLCLVLPQGRFNNPSDQYLRDFIAERARVLAVVGLHPNTFKPHTQTKTSVIFLQKWNDDPTAGPLCSPVDDYPVFFAVSQRGGKDTSGEYEFMFDDRAQPLLDSHGHMIVDHDLDEIASAFVEWGREQGLAFLREEE